MEVLVHNQHGGAVQIDRHLEAVGCETREAGAGGVGRVDLHLLERAEAEGRCGGDWVRLEALARDVPVPVDGGA
jgi:hypothetical protein